MRKLYSNYSLNIKLFKKYLLGTYLNDKIDMKKYLCTYFCDKLQFLFYSAKSALAASCTNYISTQLKNNKQLKQNTFSCRFCIFIK